MTITTGSRAGAFALAALAAVWVAGCTSETTDNGGTPSSSGGNKSSSTTKAAGGSSASSANGGSTAKGGTTGAGGTSSSTSVGSSAGGASSSAAGGAVSSSGSAKGGSSATGGSTSKGGSSSTSSAAGSTSTCGTTVGTYVENTTFAAEGSTAPYQFNSWSTDGSTAQVADNASLTRTTQGPGTLDCSAGCALLSVKFVEGIAAYSAAQMIQYFGDSATAAISILGEAVTIKAALEVIVEDGMTAPKLAIAFTTYDPSGDTLQWTDSLGTSTNLDYKKGDWYTYTLKKVPDGKNWESPPKTVCAANTHAIGIQVQNTEATKATITATVNVYVQSITVTPPGGAGGSAGAAGTSGVGTAGSTSVASAGTSGSGGGEAGAPNPTGNAGSSGSSSSAGRGNLPGGGRPGFPGGGRFGIAGSN